MSWNHPSVYMINLFEASCCQRVEILIECHVSLFINREFSQNAGCIPSAMDKICEF
jgi:hypothetical protein